MTRPTATRLPAPLRTAAYKIKKDRQMNDAVVELVNRREMSSPLAATLAGIAINPLARSYWNKQLDSIWSAPGKDKVKVAGEIVIGAGIHAAIYATNRVAKGHPAPVVLEAGTVGGSFAISNNPSFFLNSRNRPGPLGLPLSGAALNVLPGSPIQPADLSGTEFQRNSDLAFVTRTALAMHAQVHTRAQVTSIEDKGDDYLVKLENGQEWITKRVIIATGLGKPFDPFGVEDKRIIDFPTFMQRFDRPFPLRGLGRVAVIGAGDSGRTVIEALTGKGPSSQMSVAALDWVDQIDWYGVGPTQQCSSYAASQRSRYKAIAGLLPENAKKGRVTPRANAELLSGGAGCVYVDERPYDHIILATGFTTAPNGIISSSRYSSSPFIPSGNRAVARGSTDLLVIGPAAQLAVTGTETRSTPAYTQAPENATALFRYADRTATLAQYLPAIGKPTLPRTRKQAKPKAKLKQPILSAKDIAAYGLVKDGGYYRESKLNGRGERVGDETTRVINRYGQQQRQREFDKSGDGWTPDMEFRAGLAVKFPPGVKAKAKKAEAKIPPKLALRDAESKGLQRPYTFYLDGPPDSNSRTLKKFNAYGQLVGAGLTGAGPELFEEYKPGVRVTYKPELPKKKTATRKRTPRKLSVKDIARYDLERVEGTGFYRPNISDPNLTEDLGNKQWYNEYGQPISPSTRDEKIDQFYPDKPVKLAPAPVKRKTKPSSKPKPLTRAEAERKGLKFGGIWYRTTINGSIDLSGRAYNEYGQDVTDIPSLRFDTFAPGVPIKFPAEKAKAKKAAKTPTTGPPEKITNTDAKAKGVETKAKREAGYWYARKNGIDGGRRDADCRINAYGQFVVYGESFDQYKPGGKFLVRAAKPERLPKKITAADARAKKVYETTDDLVSRDTPRFNFWWLEPRRDFDNTRINVYGQQIKRTESFTTFYPGRKFLVRAGRTKVAKPKPYTIAEAKAKGVRIPRKGVWRLGKKVGSFGNQTRLNRWGQRITYGDEFDRYYPRRKQLV